MVLTQLQELLADFTGNELEEIRPESHLEDDVGMTLSEDFPRLMAQINAAFEIKLNHREVLAELEEADDTVAELAKLIADECELG
jgi:hypothetical protein